MNKIISIIAVWILAIAVLILGVGIVFGQENGIQIFLPMVNGKLHPLPTPHSDPLVYIDDNIFTYVDDDNDLHITGEVVNMSAHNLRSVSFVVNGYDNKLELIAWTFITVNPPQGFLGMEAKSCFELKNWVNRYELDSYRFEPVIYQTFDQPFAAIEINNTSVLYDPLSQTLHIHGTIVNNAGRLVQNVRVVTTVYGNNDINVLACKTDILTPYLWSLDVNQVVTYDADLQGSIFAKYTSYRMQVYGE